MHARILLLTCAMPCYLCFVHACYYHQHTMANGCNSDHQELILLKLCVHLLLHYVLSEYTTKSKQYTSGWRMLKFCYLHLSHAGTSNLCRYLSECVSVRVCGMEQHNELQLD